MGAKYRKARATASVERENKRLKAQVDRLLKSVVRHKQRAERREKVIVELLNMTS